MLAGAGLARCWPHDRAHWFFSRARWNPDDLGLAVAGWWWRCWCPPGSRWPSRSMTRCSGGAARRCWAASWFHDGSAPGPAKTGYGNNWVIAADRGQAARCSAGRWPSRCWPSWSSRTPAPRPGCGWPAAWPQMLAGALPGRAIHVVADSAYAGGELKKLPARRHLDHPAAQGRRPVRAAAAAHRQARPAPREGRPAALPGQARRHRARSAAVTVTRYGKTAAIAGRRGHLPVALGLRHPARHRRADPRPVRQPAMTWPWSPPIPPPPPRRSSSATPPGGRIEVAIEDARQIFGAGQARNRTARAVERTVPFQLACQAIATCWYATAGHDPADVARSPRPRPLVHHQGPAIDRRHGRQAPPRHHRRQISGISP